MYLEDKLLRVLEKESELPRDTQTSQQSLRSKQVEKEQYGVHATHCCKRHGCKYGNENCPVELGLVKQEYGCEQGDDFDEDCFLTDREENDKRWKDVIDRFYVENDSMISEWSDKKKLILEYQKWLKEHYNVVEK